MLELTFFILLYLLLHTYVVFPLSLFILAKGKKQNELIYNTTSNDLPFVSILLAAYNEENVIEEKINSTFSSTYPLDKIEFLIGSDASTDETNAIIEHYASKYPAIKFELFQARSGKVKIINSLATKANGEVLILTDANVFFNQNTIYQLVKHFKNEKIGLVGGNILNYNIKSSGISYQEKSYLALENKIKYQEGIIWGTMMGAFGGLYALRKTLFTAVPESFIVDDFFQTLQVIDKGNGAINELEAIAYEDVSNNISDEYKRKVRIGAGNFQNFFHYLHFLNPIKWGRFYPFFSHKVLRWLGPFVIIALLLVNAFLLNQCFYTCLFIAQIALLCVPLLDMLLKKISINMVLMRFVSHFYVMNMALLAGFVKYIKGVKNSTWSPTKRFQ